MQSIKDDNEKDRQDFFNMLSHMEFKQTLKTIVNSEERNIGHIAALLKKEDCMKVLRERFNVPMNQPDTYGKTAFQYMMSK